MDAAKPAPTRKELTHERIVDTAARALRRAGFDGVGVADVMKEAGLTHGGFYAHFASRDALLIEALERAGMDGTTRIAHAITRLQAKGMSPFAALVTSYLSDHHLAGAELGCPVAALCADMPRQSEDVRQASAQRVQNMIRWVAQALPEDTDPALAASVTSTLVGALQLARAAGDEQAGKAILAATRQHLLSQFDRPRTTTPH
ncbi:MAG: TetR/AcrR family transcriptional regulator [Rubrivivax sp.]|nr:MAG: TetR/AcrR family transcriptional regulator [Rubrivivax sp.]